MPKKQYNNNPIGVFDSGLGGLTVVRELLRQLPNEDIVYFGDTARVPYGAKSKESVVRFSKQNAAFLLKHKVKIIVVACNTSSSLALGALKRHCRVPLVSVITPGARKACATTRNKKIGVVATVATIKSRSYEKNIKRLDTSVHVTLGACPLFVPMVEEGRLDGVITTSIAKEYLKKLKAQGVDTLILGCTHYPLLKRVIQKVMGSRVTLVDSAQEVACEVRELLKKERLGHRPRRKGRCSFWVSDEPDHFRQLAKRFLGFQIRKVGRGNV